MNRFLLVAVNAKYIHSNPAVYSLRGYVEASLRTFVEIKEYTINQSLQDILADIYARKPRVIGFSCYIWNWRMIQELIEELPKLLPETDIWLGGPEVSYDAPGILKEYPQVTGIMIGEGEATFAELLESYVKLWEQEQAEAVACAPSQAHNLQDIPGLCLPSGYTPMRELTDMNKLSFLYEDLEPFTNRIIYYESSRGCPYRCSYCLSSIDKKVRLRDISVVKRELQFFLDKRVAQVKFVDRTFNCDHKHAMEVWQYILEHDNGVTNFHFEISADILREEEIALLNRMRPGLVQLEIGVQSTNLRTIEAIDRVMNVEKLEQIVAAIHRGNNVHQHLDLIAGLPYEDYESFHRSFNDVYAMEPEQLQLGFLKVLKGSYMYEMAEKYDLVCRTLPPYEVLSTRWLPYDDVLRLKGVEDMVEVYYNSRQYTKTLQLLIREFADAFAMFEQLARYYKAHGLAGLNHSRMARYEILHDFIREQTVPERMAEYEDALICDVYLRENAKSRPAFAREQAPFKNRIRELVPELRALGTQVHVEVLRNGEILLFDYREKDPLTRNAKLMRIGTLQTENGEV